MKLPAQKVSSSNIDEVSYDPATLELFVKFKEGGLYKYSEVSAAKHQALLAAPSKGKYLESNIKRTHPFEKLA